MGAVTRSRHEYEIRMFWKKLATLLYLAYLFRSSVVYPSPNPGAPASRQVHQMFFAALSRRWPLAGWDLFVSVLGVVGSMFGAPWVDESSEPRITSNHWRSNTLAKTQKPMVPWVDGWGLWVDEPNSCGFGEVPFQTDVGPPNEEDQPTQRLSTRQQRATT